MHPLAVIFSKNNFKVNTVLASEDKNIFRDLDTCLLESDTIKFFMKNIPCKCLKKKYKQVKSEIKTGRCMNCKVVKERKLLFLCERCEYSHYCSVECQEAEYPEHKDSDVYGSG